MGSGGGGDLHGMFLLSFLVLFVVCSYGDAFARGSPVAQCRAEADSAGCRALHFGRFRRGVADDLTG